jgi:pyruvate/2-oxoglutarate dehydrogenase complex dihydrolipoamide dehydrogenase (E3) component
MLDQILPAEEPEIAKLVAREFKAQNITVMTGVGAEQVTATDDGVDLTLGGEQQSFDYLCIAAGRAPDVEALGLEAAGVKLLVMLPLLITKYKSCPPRCQPSNCIHTFTFLNFFRNT